MIISYGIRRQRCHVFVIYFSFFHPVNSFIQLLFYSEFVMVVMSFIKRVERWRFDHITNDVEDSLLDDRLFCREITLINK